MPPKKTPAEKIAALEKKKDQLTAQIQKQKSLEKQESRKRDTRRKIIAGALALEHMEYSGEFSEVMKKLLRENVTRPEDRKLFEDL